MGLDKKAIRLIREMEGYVKFGEEASQSEQAKYAALMKQFSVKDDEAEFDWESVAEKLTDLICEANFFQKWCVADRLNLLTRLQLYSECLSVAAAVAVRPLEMKARGLAEIKPEG